MDKKLTVSKHNSDKNKTIFLILFGLIITVPLMFRGLYFEKEQLPVLTSIYIIFITWVISNRKDARFKIISTPIDYAFLGIILMYMVTIFYGVNKRESILEYGRHLAYFILYIMTKYICKEKDYEKIVINIILLGGLIVTLIGVGTGIGTWSYTDAMLGGRLSSTFQYPNTLASYIVALYFISSTALINEENRWYKIFYGANMGVFIFSLILTYSRAMWLITPIVLISYFVMLPSSRKVESLLYMIGSAIISIPIAFIFNKGLANPTPKLWLLFLLVALGTGMLILLISTFAEKFRNISMKKLLFALGTIVLVSFLGLIYVINSITSLTLENPTDEDRWSNTIRAISATIPNSNYILKLNYTGQNKSSSPYMGSVAVYNVDSKNNLQLLETGVLVEEGEKAIEVPFTTSEDSIGIKVYFQNVYKNTRVTFNTATVYDESLKLIKDIPLKYKYIPENIIARFSSISTGENSLTARMTFNKDGIKVLSQNPIFGAGGGAWVSLYQMYQSYMYWTTLAHNFVLQLWIEIGTIGLLLFLLMLGLIFIYSLKSIRATNDINQKVLIVGLFTTIVSMIFHGIVDFDMSLPAYSLVFWTIIGLLVNQLNIEKPRFDKVINRFNPKMISYIMILLCTVLIYNLSNIMYSEKYKALAIEANESYDIDSAISNFEKVVKYDKYIPSYKIDLANAYLGKYHETTDVKYVHQGIELVDEYIKLSPFDTTAYAMAGFYNLSIGEIEKGLEQIDNSVRLQPMRTENYIQKINGYKSVMDFYISQGENEKAEETVKRALTIKEDVKNVNKLAVRPLTINNDLIKSIGEVQYFYENIDKILLNMIQGLQLNFAYYFDLDINNDGNIDMLYSSIPQGSNLKHESMYEGEDNFIRITNDSEVYGFNYVYPLSLEPNTSYVVELKARGNTKPETFNLYAWANGTADPNQGNLTAIELGSQWETYSFEFTTDSDVVSGTQYIRIQHNGNDIGYIDIKELIIFKKN